MIQAYQPGQILNVQEGLASGKRYRRHTPLGSSPQYTPNSVWIESVPTHGIALAHTTLGAAAIAVIRILDHQLTGYMPACKVTNGVRYLRGCDGGAFMKVALVRHDGLRFEIAGHRALNSGRSGASA